MTKLIYLFVLIVKEKKLKEAKPLNFTVRKSNIMYIMNIINIHQEIMILSAFPVNGFMVTQSLEELRARVRCRIYQVHTLP